MNRKPRTPTNSLEARYAKRPEGLTLGRSDKPPKLGTYTPRAVYRMPKRGAAGTSLLMPSVPI